MQNPNPESVRPALEQLHARADAARCLGSASFRAAYGVAYAYAAGAMYKGIASRELVVAMGRRGLLSFFGAGGLDLGEVESAIADIRRGLPNGEPFGMNLLCHPADPDLELRTADLYLRHGVRFVEAAAFMQITPALAKIRLKGIRPGPDGVPQPARRIMAKVSRPEVAAHFLQPAPEKLLQRLVQDGQLSAEEAELGRAVPMADDLCVEADSGGHTDQGVAYALLPSIQRLRADTVEKFGWRRPIHVGAAGGIGAPQAVAAAFMMGADFVLTGSVNQCTAEAGTSGSVKDMLQQMNVQDTDYAPAGDMFELGARVQVFKRGVFFPARANKLHELYTRHESLEEIDPKTMEQLEAKYFGRPLQAVWQDVQDHYARKHPDQLAEMRAHPKRRMAAVFKWYFAHTSRLALRGEHEQRVNYQVHCGPALGAFNQWVKGTPLEDWRARHVADIGEMLMQGAADAIEGFMQRWNAQRAALAQQPATAGG